MYNIVNGFFFLMIMIVGYYDTWSNIIDHDDIS